LKEAQLKHYRREIAVIAMSVANVSPVAEGPIIWHFQIPPNGKRHTPPILAAFKSTKKGQGFSPRPLKTNLVLAGLRRDSFLGLFARLSSTGLNPCPFRKDRGPQTQ